MAAVELLPPDVVGDGCHDDTAGIQAVLDSGASTVFLPRPPGHYLIRRMLRLHSGQTLRLDRNARVRLADHAHAHLLGNADPERGNAGITVLGGIWDGNNAHQTCAYHKGVDWHVCYDPRRYLGVLMQFNRVTDLRLAHVTLKDPETFGIQVGNLLRFSIEDITFDYNLLKLNMDGVHLHGNCRHGRITNLKGTTNDDMVALNADDGWMFEMSRGPIEDVQVDGLFAENGYTAVRLLSSGSPIRRVRISNLFGSFRYYVVSFTNEGIHPEERSDIDDVVVDGVFCAKPTESLPNPLPTDAWGCHNGPLFPVASGTHVGHVHLLNVHRHERLADAPPTVKVEAGSTVRHLSVRGAAITNGAPTPLDFVVNEGEIGRLRLTDVSLRTEGGEARGHLLVNRGTIRHQELSGVSAEGLLS